ncbi:MAG: DnaJ domain-containing protein [Planctomycetes bacterium]|nr:DnaJ domain-containing protein [Planctomycetota bacterium]
MGVKFQDYYSTLGVARSATEEEIRRAYRKLARSTHPDVDKTSGAAERFKQIAEAYEVLKDPATRKRYDALGAQWKEGQEFTPPSGFEGGWRSHSQTGRRATAGAHADFGGFSSFFESLFGDGFQSDGRGGFSARQGPQRGASLEADLEITLEEAVRGGKRALQLRSDDPEVPARRIEVTVPPKSYPGMTMRLAGLGHAGSAGAGDLLLRIVIAPHAQFGIKDNDLTTRLSIQPHEAALGAGVPLKLVDGSEVTVRVPPGTSSGKTLRLRGLGLKRRDGVAGDLLVEIAIEVPTQLTEAERKLYSELAELRKKA